MCFYYFTVYSFSKLFYAPTQQYNRANSHGLVFNFPAATTTPKLVLAFRHVQVFILICFIIETAEKLLVYRACPAGVHAHVRLMNSVCFTLLSFIKAHAIYDYDF